MSSWRDFDTKMTPKGGVPPLEKPAADAALKEEGPIEQAGGGGTDRLASWLASLLVHFVLLLVLGLATYAVRPSGGALELLALKAEGELPGRGLDSQSWVVEPDRRPGAAAVEAQAVDVSSEAPQVAMPNAAPSAGDAQAKPAEIVERAEDRPHGADIPSGGGLEGRGREARAGLAGNQGGSRESEAAVERGLNWLVAHQRPDGGWSFDLTKPPCNGMCRNSGKETSTTAATALALLPFLGAGYTHREGEHQEVVKRGLYYLGTRARQTPHGVDLQEGTMYAQGLATIALCEAYAMTQDPALRPVAQEAIRFIVFAQDLKGGGWRYTPGTPGDVTVTGWQLMALKSGLLAKLNVPSPTTGLVEKFLDSVQTDGGSRYNYMVAEPPRETRATTAVGLLCRMYTGWQRDKPALYRGIAHLHRWGPSETNMYYNYYAAQVLRHWGGPEWLAWNRRMRDHLVATQAGSGHESGSWHFPDAYGDAGGRLYNTAMAVLTLEVYYRYLPLYGTEATSKRF